VRACPVARLSSHLLGGDLPAVCAGEPLEDGGGNSGCVQAVGLQDQITGGVWQEPGWQGEGGRAGVRPCGGQGLGYPGAERSGSGGVLDREHQAVRPRQLDQCRVQGCDPARDDHGDRAAVAGQLFRASRGWSSQWK